MDIKELLKKMKERNSSDLHISAGYAPKIRLDGDIVDLDNSHDSKKLTNDDVIKIMNDICSKEQYSNFEKTKDIDISYAIPNLARFRVNCFEQSRGYGIVFRIIPDDIKSLNDLDLPRICVDLCAKPRGLILVTGPTGSGKSTTLAAMVDHINQNFQKHIITIEDPIEFIHKEKKCLINQREVHSNTDSFASALRASLREDPDILLVGELRDLETIRLALTAAETGHLVFGTLHTTSATKTIDRLIDVFPAAEKDMVRAMISESLEAVISQLLLKRISGGRVAAHEIMISTPAIRNLIRENKLAQMHSSIQTGQNFGMITLDQTLKNLVGSDQIKKEVAAEVAKEPSSFA